MRVLNFLSMTVLSLLLISCASGSSSNNNTNQSYLLGTLPNGASVSVSQRTFNLSSNQEATGTIIASGTMTESSYTLALSIPPSGPDGVLIPTPCNIIGGGEETETCHLNFTKALAVPGTYTVAVTYQPNTSSAQVIESAIALPNSITLIVD